MLDKTYYFATQDMIFQVKGEKAATFLHGQFTNSISDLADGSGNYNLFLSLKGKVRADLYVMRQDNKYFVVVPKKFASIVTDHLKKLAPLSRCELVDLSDQYQVFHVFGNLSDPYKKLNLFEVQERDVFDQSLRIFRTDRLGEMGCDLWVLKESVEVILKNFEDQGFQKMADADRDLLRIKNKIPLVGVDATESHLPQEATLKNAIHFNKGCYLGQEVVARLEHRGHINKVLSYLTTDLKNIEVGCEIDCNGKPCGQVTSVAFDPDENLTYFMSYLPVDQNKQGNQLNIKSGKATVR